MKLLTKAIENKIPALYATDGVPTDEKVVHAKFFNPVGAAVWFVVEYDPTDQLFFGFAYLGDPEMAEWGYISKAELEALKLPFGMKVERDIHFDPVPWAEVKESFKMTHGVDFGDK